ncbi:Rod shape-determining protein MreD [Rhodovastum atsumiense]|uniref:Rod shape-determining protein MreD n=1 Tax=Rhodovastum atsumiense TaxID=504468 RepID=A0A5M6IXS5_9PROT|nr:rod shape-determining protein MreD [Rhodovastum atsumiense]KAA5613071.1 rod shape-determining protein MreD [Rhodovastum atsumiense]CAH2600067.1 Rod shape-determining protein MreD [Rhodovastum atsumiense]
MDREPGIRPRQSLGRRLDVVARRSFPVATTALLLLLTAGPLELPAQAQLQCAMVLGCVFFWSLFRPASMPPASVFALGLLADLLGFAPVGVSVLTLLITHGIAFHSRRVLARQGFLLVWMAFLGIAAGAAALQWGLISLLTFRLLPVGPAIFQAILSAGLYPPLAVLLTRSHVTLAEPARA